MKFHCGFSIKELRKLGMKRLYWESWWGSLKLSIRGNSRGQKAFLTCYGCNSAFKMKFQFNIQEIIQICMLLPLKKTPVYQTKKFRLYKIVRQIVPTSEMWTFRVADNVKWASNYRATIPHCHGHLSALPGLRFTATVLIAFEICGFQSQLAISIVSFVLLLWILYCLIKLFPY